jgi:hypothetical protein
MRYHLDRSVYSCRCPALAVFLALGFAQAAPGSPQEPGATSAPAPKAASPPPTSPRSLSEADSKRVDALNKAIDTLWREGKFAEAIEPASQVVAIWEKSLGTDHPRAVDARRFVDDLRTIVALPQDARRAMTTARDLESRALTAYNNAQYADAEQGFRSLLEIRRRWLGDDHPKTAESCIRLAGTLEVQKKHGEAEVMYRQAFAILRRTRGEEDPRP